jgi:cysteine desulfurase
LDARIAFDHNASAPLLPQALEAMLVMLPHQANPSSVHAEGRLARKAIEDARASLAEAVGCAASRIVFTSGASEAAAHALSPVLRKGASEIRLGALHVSAVEHPCVLAGGRFAAGQTALLPVDGEGRVDCDALEEALRRHDPSSGPAMVAVQAANNETGVLQPLDEISRIARAHGAFVTVDAAQAFGKAGFRADAVDADFILLSAHKIGGPQGAGALILGRDGLAPLPLIAGGGQEGRQRAGTQNVAAIAGFGAAARHLWSVSERAGIARLRDLIEQQVRSICAKAGNRCGPPAFFSANAPRLANTSCFAIAGLKAETAVIALDLAGVAVSSGSACSSGKVQPSHVLQAMGVDGDLARCALRISIGAGSNEDHVDRFAEALERIVRRSGQGIPNKGNPAPGTP